MFPITYFSLKKMTKFICRIFLVLFFLSSCSYCALHGLQGFEENRIDAAKNARSHSNLGNIYFSEKNYYGALREYQIAFNLTYNQGSASTYLYNIARCFIELGDYNGAKKAILMAIDSNCLNITYYETLVDCYIYLGIEQKELENCLQDSFNPYNRIIAGLIYLKCGYPMYAKVIFDEFILDNPDMIISDSVRAILRKI